MNEQDLKNSILKLAIEGKLVEQREEEGTAKELLEKISIEKERLVKEKKIRKEKPLPKIIEDDINFDIPESWEWTRITNIADLYTGNSIPKSIREGKYSKVKEGYDYIATKDVEFNNVIKFENGIKIPYEEEKFKYSYKDSILMCIEGGSAGRKIGILDRKVCFGNKLCSFNSIIIEPLFLYYYLQSPQFINVFKENMTGIIGGVSITKLKAIILPLPPLEEQKRIVAKIEELMPYAEKYGESYSKVERLNKKFPEDIEKSILQYAMKGKLVGQREEEGTAEELYKQIQDEKKKIIKEGKIKKIKALPEITEDEIPFDIPENWKWVRFSDLGITQTGNTPSKAKAEYFGNYIPFIGPGDILNGSINYQNQGLSEKGKEVARISEKQSILQVCIGGSIGKCAVNIVDVSYNQQINAITPLVCNYLYVYYLMDSKFFLSSMMSKATGTATPIINKSSWESLIVPLPPIEEQKRIVAKIEEMLPYAKKMVK